MTAYLDLADYLLIAEAVLGVPAESIARWPGIGLAESALQAPDSRDHRGRRRWADLGDGTRELAAKQRS